ncbi:FG-GAP-like repeat-containing protein [Segetibacter aerophilus]|uniref:FG-GAP-like repeat-containing protein n=1 Tax=Segetibacter aerophilus TaxID=670293 RepID=UPI0011BE46DD|nr:FG-GAP-like repeat-containing protein [Segetibacter aerophilus]
MARKFSPSFLLAFLVLCSCKRTHPLFTQVSSSKSNIHFNNKFVENDTINPIDITNIYNGGGVGIGDFNNDGLQDLYFSGSTVPNKLYLNKGELKFDDVTEKANVAGDGKWCRGISVVDINNDGWMDMYVSATLSSNVAKRENLLYINQGSDKDGVPHFKELAREYGLNDTTHSTMAAFFDYDSDGDLDVYIVVNEIIKGNNPAVFRPIIRDGSFPSTGRLYKNDWNSQLKHPFYTNVSKEAGITIEGYGHGVNITDINRDGWKDIFVTNDFNSNDILYINNGNGTFTDKAADYFKHTSANGMGQDIIDINNDGLSDVVEVDMSPEDNYRKKMMLGANSYQTYQNSDHFGYQYQYVRNTLQLNQGPRVKENDSIGDPIFSDVGFFSGISETDWSWTPLVSDFDNDGYRDIIVTNGYPKDLTDHDFIAFRQQSSAIASKQFTLSQIPEVKLHNYAFHNNGNVTFSNVSTDWGLSAPSFSNGGAYADLDNDGDMDMVINNINDEAMLYENNSTHEKETANNFLNVKLVGDALNRNGIGTWIQLYYQGKQQAYEQSPYRGYLSSVQLDPHFGLGNVSTIDSMVVTWTNGNKQVLRGVQANKTITVDIKNAIKADSFTNPVFATNMLFTDISGQLGIPYKDSSKDFIDFNIQKLLPHKFTEYGPALAVGDINGDGLEDMVVGGPSGISPTMLLQQSNGLFKKKAIFPFANNISKQWKDIGITLFDADGDGDLDLFTASGGFEKAPNSDAYQDKLYINDGKEGFTISPDGLPVNHTSKSCVRASDYDNDGDLDLFIAGRVEPWNYPKPVSSFIYRNDSKNGEAKFTDVTNTVAKTFKNIGLVCDAVWTDFNNDGWQDLVITGEWMPVIFYANNKGTFQEVTASSNVGNKKGWWTSIVPGDFDNDGDVDFVVGNLGLNSFFKASEKYPVSIYAKDFDNNGNFDAVPTIYLPASQEDPTRKEYPAHVRDDMTKQLISFRSKFQNYKKYANATFDKMFTEEEMKGALKLQVNYFNNSYVRNDGNGKFTMSSLPLETQYSCMNGMLSEDFDGDGNLDLLATGNDYGTEVSVGRYDACNGLFLKGDGKGGFRPLKILESGWFVPGNAKALVKLRRNNGKCLIVASHNRGNLKTFEMKKPVSYISLNPTETSVLVTYKDGRRQKREIGYGASFLSQSGRFVNTDGSMRSVEIKDFKGNVRTVSL